MSGSRPFPSARYARSSRLVAYLAIAYLLLVVYASLYPFADWRVPNDEATRFLFAGWPSYIVASDVVLNVLAYVPIGLLLTLLWMGRVPRWAAVALGATAGMLLSLSIEFAQAYLPTRISSNVDVLTNSIGTFWGAAAAHVWGERWLLSGELHRLRERHFRPGARTDLAFVLLALWLLTQLNAEIWLFGNGDLRHLLPVNLGMHYSADAYLLLEAGVAALNFAGVAFLTGAIARSFFAAAVSVTALTLTALMLKSIASMALFIPGNPGLWLTPGSVLGLVAGVMLWLPLARCSPASSMRAAAICFAAGFFLVNLAPENPYLVAALQILQRGQFLRLNAMTGLLSAWWPFLVFAYLVFLMRGDNEDGPDSGRSGN
jgi:VanZ family protein